MIGKIFVCDLIDAVKELSEVVDKAKYGQETQTSGGRESPDVSNG